MTDKFARTNNICLVIITLIASTSALIFMKPVLVPLIFSIFVFAIFNPFVTLIEKKLRLPKTLALTVSILLLFLTLTTLVFVIMTSVERFVNAAPRYLETLNSSLIIIEELFGRFRIPLKVEAIKEIINNLPLIQYAQTLTSQLFAFMANLFLIFIYVLFMMTGKTQSKHHPLLDEILFKVSAYISAKFLLCLIMGTISWTLLLFFGIELAFVFAVLTIFLNFIPNIGSILSVVLPLPVVFLHYQLGMEFFIVLGILGFAQFFIGNVLEPKVLGESMDLHPITVLICLIFWGMIWGLPGLFLSVPITAVIKIVFSRIEATQILSELLAGRLP